MRVLNNIGKKKLVIGMVHLKPLPGTPYYEEGYLEESIDKAVSDAIALEKGGADGCLVQTVDRVYPSKDEADYARVASMTKIVNEISKAVSTEFQIGVQFMINGLKPAIAVAKVCGASFIRCAALVGTIETPGGSINTDTLDFLNYRKLIGAQDIKLIAEVDSIHNRAKGDEHISFRAGSAFLAGAFAVEVAHPDEEKNAQVVRDIKQVMPGMPVILGGHTNHENVARRIVDADGVFAGTCLQKKGVWGGAIDIDRVREYTDIVSSL